VAVEKRLAGRYRDLRAANEEKDGGIDRREERGDLQNRKSKNIRLVVANPAGGKRHGKRILPDLREVKAGEGGGTY